MQIKGTVLVTGGSVFIASYCIIALLNIGYQVDVKTHAKKLKAIEGKLLKVMIFITSRLMMI